MGIKVLFIDPNIFGMNMLTPAIALFSSMLKERGHKVELFDTTYYPTDRDIETGLTSSNVSGTSKSEDKSDLKPSVRKIEKLNSHNPRCVKFTSAVTECVKSVESKNDISQVTPEHFVYTRIYALRRPVAQKISHFRLTAT